MIALAGAAALAGLAACSNIQPSLGQYGIVTGHGALSNQQVQKVVSPGVKYDTGSGTTTWYVPADVRNYVTGTDPNNSDRTNPQAELTGSKGASSGMSDYAYTYVGFILNPKITVSHSFAQQFLGFCLKYACASLRPQNDSSNNSLAHSSSPGWNNMLAEVFPHAIDNATQTAIQNFGPGLWNTRGDWTTLGEDIAKDLPGEIAKMTGNPSDPYFCGPGSTTAKCTPFIVLVNNVVPADAGVQQAYNQQQTALYSQQAGAARLKAAQSVYGKDANWFLGMLDLVNACQAKGVACNIYAGNAPFHP